MDLRFVRYGVVSFAECLNHYENAIGLPMRFTDGAQWAEFSTGDTRFAIEKIRPGDLERKTYRGACFQSEDLDRLWEDLKKGSIEVSDIQIGEHERFATIRDPDGNEVIVFAPTL